MVWLVALRTITITLGYHTVPKPHALVELPGFNSSASFNKTPFNFNFLRYYITSGAEPHHKRRLRALPIFLVGLLDKKYFNSVKVLRLLYEIN